MTLILLVVIYIKDREETLKALKTFSRSLTCTNNDYEEVIINKWSIQLLNLLQSTDEEIIYYSICCITNIAAGSSELVNSVVKTIPYLTLLLSNEAPKIKNQAAWALGNIAGEKPENSKIIIDNGALGPIVQMLESNDKDLVQTAGFTLSNLCRGSNPPLDKIYNNGIMKPLFIHLNNDNNIEEISELIWICVYYSASKDDKYLNILLDNNITHNLIKYLEYCLNSPNDLNYAIPIIRTIGNICSSSLDRGTELLLKEDKFFNLMLQCIQSSSRIIRKESLWALSGLTAGTINEVNMVINANFIPVLCKIIATDTFDIKKEAAYSILNISTRSKEYLKKFPEEELLPIFINIVQNTQDIELAQLGIKYLAWELQNNKELFKSHENTVIDALESIPIKFYEEDNVKQMASLVLDTYWEENNKMEI
ncbi:ARM repeat-containing protein [Neocallimastix lanati (nom. inval.)]|uniref:ARM repeat-containing protein n=1 Tax=Neocallimastix californiae TaxID=1754190 RepID=A0A1Y2ENT8_9FUNG|nr:ARM repeat-containing protein [Neocallimastix sp. JGI-2020a]ORY72964.1 ARM repeat-containing protein [Neocallimastix californiae]|eukprot:ORY72964.1 ARM repeat-containing protein [Neocallimastix californiae]